MKVQEIEITFMKVNLIEKIIKIFIKTELSIFIQFGNSNQRNSYVFYINLVILN